LQVPGTLTGALVGEKCGWYLDTGPRGVSSTRALCSRRIFSPRANSHSSSPVETPFLDKERLRGSRSDRVVFLRQRLGSCIAGSRIAYIMMKVIQGAERWHGECWWVWYKKWVS
jgi:hypothetical protein